MDRSNSLSIYSYCQREEGGGDRVRKSKREKEREKKERVASFKDKKVMFKTR